MLASIVNQWKFYPWAGLERLHMPMVPDCCYFVFGLQRQTFAEYFIVSHVFAPVHFTVSQSCCRRRTSSLQFVNVNR